MDEHFLQLSGEDFFQMRVVGFSKVPGFSEDCCGEDVLNNRWFTIQLQRKLGTGAGKRWPQERILTITYCCGIGEVGKHVYFRIPIRFFAFLLEELLEHVYALHHCRF